MWPDLPVFSDKAKNLELHVESSGFQCTQPIHLISPMKDIYRPCVACGLTLTNSVPQFSHQEQTPFYTLLSSLGPGPSPSLPDNKDEWPVVPLSTHLPSLCSSSPCKSLLQVLPTSWPRCRGANAQPSGMASRPPSWSLALLPSATFITILFMALPPYILQVSPKGCSYCPFLFFSLSVVSKHTMPHSPFCGRHPCQPVAP